MNNQKKFQKRVEDFSCEKCGFANVGNGYTNHCKKCLWSKHVDINPGDRAEKCGGLMEPILLHNNSDEFFIRHKCITCGFEKNNKFQDGDNFEELIKISQKFAKN
ncbi:MAG TPA: RNHCP domain-containing protein [Candidatus Paceibacterota bacterium]|nr:RNHCP domain-containing protein [Candidatus Paceibacterota bacterium]